jgi:hypothetical protein
MSLGIHFPILLCQTNRQYRVWWTVSVTQEACRTETVPVDLRCCVDFLYDILQNLLRSPLKSLRKLFLQSLLSYGSVHKATKILKFHPHRVNVMHELKERDKEKRLPYCRWFTHFIRGCIYILDKDFFCDEAWFHLSVQVNSQNSRIWSVRNSAYLPRRTVTLLKNWVWCVVSRRRIIVPIFFSETKTTESYQELIMNFISLLEADEQDCWFQQDGATAHTAN